MFRQVRFARVGYEYCTYKYDDGAPRGARAYTCYLLARDARPALLHLKVVLELVVDHI